jgi:tetratricopeptide (TPR) repeat protein
MRSTLNMTSNSTERQVKEAVLDFTLGEYTVALEKLDQVIFTDPECFDAHLAKTEVLYAMELYEDALATAEQAEMIESEEVHLKTSLSRIWMQLGDKEKAETYGASAKMLNWKNELLQGDDGENTTDKDLI